jgi:hypothetical protein
MQSMGFLVDLFVLRIAYAETILVGPAQGVGNIMKNNSGEVTKLLAFLAGAVVAAGLTLVLTPRPGREVREKLGDVKEDAVHKLRICAREAKFRVSPKTKADAFYYEGGDCWI